MILDEQIAVGTAENLTNKQFGRLTVLYRVKNTGKTRGAKWRCKCSCGNTIDVLASNLKKGHTQSCGCLQKEKISQTRFINEIGKKYGRLTVIERGEDYIDSNGQHKVKWICKCDCGNIVSVLGVSLRKGATTSCGCYRKEQISNRIDTKYIGKTFHHITVLNKIDKKNNGEKLWVCECNLCGKNFILPTGKLSTQISCGCLQDSYGVSVIKQLLQKNNIYYETEKTFDTCIFKDTNKKARFDFYIDNKYLLEFDGQQHYYSSSGWNTEEQLKSTQEKDQYKNKWCFENNIPLIRIPYWEVDNLSINDLLITSKFLYQGDYEDGE